MKTLNVLNFSQLGPLSVLQVQTEKRDAFSYISSAKAIERGLIAVQETSEAGNVNELLVRNPTEHFVFFMDGDILAGAKQNRVLNTSMLLAPKSKTIVPVSCVEQGRWRFTSSQFSQTPHTAPSSLRAMKSSSISANLQREGRHRSDQVGIWDHVSCMQEIHAFKSSTSNLSDLYDAKPVAFIEFIHSFAAVDGANGLATFIGNRLQSVDVFHRTDIYAEYFPKLIISAALECYGLGIKTEAFSRTEAEGIIRETMARVDSTDVRKHPGVGLGTEKRFDDQSITGFELEYNTHRIHFSLLTI